MDSGKPSRIRIRQSFPFLCQFRFSFLLASGHAESQEKQFITDKTWSVRRVIPFGQRTSVDRSGIKIGRLVHINPSAVERNLIEIYTNIKKVDSRETHRVEMELISDLIVKILELFCPVLGDVGMSEIWPNG